MYNKPRILSVDKKYEAPNFLLEVEACGCYGSY